MKKILTIAFAMLLGASLSVAQATGGTPASTDKPAKKGSSTKSGKKGAKGGKKGKKSSGTTTPPPK